MRKKNKIMMLAPLMALCLSGCGAKTGATKTVVECYHYYTQYSQGEYQTGYYDACKGCLAWRTKSYIDAETIDTWNEEGWYVVDYHNVILDCNHLDGYHKHYVWVLAYAG